MGRLEQAIAYFAPGVAARRAEARMRIRAIERARAYYDGADTGRRGGSIRRSGASADTISYRSLPKLRAGSHDLARNNPYAARGIEAIVANIVGAGIVPRFKRGEQSVQRLQDLSKQTLETTDIDADGQHDYYGLTALACRTMVESGESLIVRQWQPRGSGFPLKFRVLEPEYINVYHDGYLPNGGQCIQGIEFDAQGRRVAYWLYREHPGGRMRSTKDVRVPASEIAHIYRMDRPGQTRGIPWLAPVMLRIADFADYEDAQLLRQKIASCFSVFYTDTLGTGAPRADTAEKVEPGMIIRLGSGADVKFGTPPTITDYKDYSFVSLHALAAGLGVSYEALTGDMSGVSFSSGKMGRLEFERNIDRWRWHTVIPQGCQRMAAWWLEAASLLGYGVNGVSVTHAPPRKEMISPDRETPAQTAAIRSGQTTLTRTLQESGIDLAEFIAERKEEQRLLDEAGIVLDSDPRRVSNSGVEQQIQAAQVATDG